MLAKVLAYLLRAWFVTCSEDEKMEEYVDGSKSCFETAHNLLDFSVIEAYSSSGPKTHVIEYGLEGKEGSSLGRESPTHPELLPHT